MDTQNTSARPHAQSRNDGENHPSRRTRAHTRSGGVIHDNTRHTTRFTVIGNHLAPGVAAWLERDLPPSAVHHALTVDLPAEPLYRPAAFLAHRLAAQLPPVPPFRAPAAPPAIRHPLHNCDDCDRAFRGPEPGTCGGCRSRHDAPPNTEEPRGQLTP
ncbi:hypothetical protein [Streptomyces sp. NBC_00853]|uniref:hypothetical protein n=1 Tax=Streptomyces sp. NBC_00853 TaxID=2903681 RepID=UPI003873ADC2